MGPSPADFIAAASFQAIRLVAAQRRLPLVDVAVTVTHTEGSAGLSFSRRIEVIGDFDEETTAELKAAGRGTVTDVLLGADHLHDLL